MDESLVHADRVRRSTEIETLHLDSVTSFTKYVSQQNQLCEYVIEIIMSRYYWYEDT